MIYLILMTAAGSILYGLYVIWTVICGRFLNHGMKYKVLIIALFLHVIPLYWLKVWYHYLWKHLLPRQAFPQSDRLVGMAEIHTASEAYATPDYRWMILIAVIWIAVTVLMPLKSCLIYLLNRRALKKVSRACYSETGIRIMERLKPQYRIRCPIEVIQVDRCRTPYTMGVFRPIIVMNGELDSGEMEWVLKHELTHIARGDVLLRLFLELVCCIYWFNPILIGFKKCFHKECESSCDERVILNCTKEEHDAYTDLLSRFMDNEQGDAHGNALSDDNDYIQERINEMKNIRKMKRWQKIVAVGVFAVFMMTDSLVALAYPRVHHVNDRKDEIVATAAVVEVADNAFIQDTEFEGLFYEVLYDNEFIDETGRIIPVKPNQPYVFCPGHSWQSGYFQSHIKNDNGGCTLYLYKAKLCPICDTIEIESLYSTTIYPKCPH